MIIVTNMENRLIEFDESAHKYTVDGAVVPNVTSILQPISAYRNFDQKKMEIARQKGLAIHKMVEFWSKGTDYKRPAWMEPAYQEWMKFVAISQFEVIESELRVYNKLYRYAGTLDLYGSVDIGFKPRKKMQCYIDVKRSLLGGDTIGYQIAA